MHKKARTALKGFGAGLAIAAAAWFAPSGADSQWQTATTVPGFDLHYGDGNDTDADVIGGFLSTAFDKITQEFSAHEPEELLEGVDLDVYLHPEAGEMASPQHATMTSNLRKRGYKAAIHMLTPSAYNGGRAEPTDEDTRDYLYRQVVHELSAVYVQRLILSKPKGWRYDDAAPWFLQGFDEYMSGKISRREEDDTLAGYRHQIRRNPGRISFSNTIRVQNPYRDGAVLVQFLHESFGRDAVQNIWLSQEPTFDKALLSALGTDMTGLEQRWTRWLNQPEALAAAPR